MIAPDVTFQTAVRAALIDNAAVAALVQPDHIRAGSTRPDKLPSIILADPQTINLGRSGEWFITRVFLDLHIWALEDGADMARQIGATVAAALWDSPVATENDTLTYVRPSFTYMRDPDPERAFCHGVGTVEGVIRWRV